MRQRHWAHRWAGTCLALLLAAAAGRAGQLPGPRDDDAPPGPLGRPLETPPEAPAPPMLPLEPEQLLQTPVDPPTGYTGPSGILPRDQQTSSHFVPVEDRWRIGFPAW